jgi:peptidoglycan/LPS O-acetylase OafA/YrhL
VRTRSAAAAASTPPGGRPTDPGSASGAGERADSTRLPALDGLRGASFALVFFGHAGLIANSGLASLAMFAFFALSGFLITALIANEHDRFGSVALSRFFARRALRLLPALGLFLVCWLAVIVIFGHEPWTTSVPGGGPGAPEPFSVALEGVGAAIGYLTNWTTIFGLSSGYVAIDHLWSLAVEEQFYLGWAPLLVLLLRRGRRPAVLVATALAVASTVEAWCIWDGGRGGLHIYMGTDTRAGAFLLGGVVGLLWSRTTGSRPSRFVPIARRAAPAAACLALAALIWSLGGLRHTSDEGAYLSAYSLDTFAAPLLVAAIAWWPVPGGPRALTGRVLTYLGQRSYALYLWHYAWLTWLRSSGTIGVVVGLAASLACAEASWHLVELPALARKARFERDGAAKPREPLSLETTAASARP